ncbi:MAG: NAD(P)-dependent oxidoreductase [Candidatus Marsarchaeota archaeon]|nr:NAD(P)-dependent oxidoreductase [Candidatus Marsarchaeota archaeon]
MAILLTGASGFLGSRIMRKLLEKDRQVVVLKRSTSDLWRIEDMMPKVKAYDVDLEGPERAFEENKISAILHTATAYGRKGESVPQIVSSNLVYPLQLMELGLAHGTGAFLNTDTFSKAQTEYADKLDYYNLTKAHLGEYARRLLAGGPMKWANLRLEHMYGPADDQTKFVPQLIRQLLGGADSIPLTEGRQRRDFVYVDDVADAYLAVLAHQNELPAMGEYGVGMGNSLSVREACELMKELCHSRSALQFGKMPMRRGEIMDSKADNAGLRALGWEPKFDAKSGFSKTIEYEKTVLKQAGKK